MSLPSGHTIEEEKGRRAELAKLFEGRKKTVSVQPGNWCFQAAIDRYAPKYYNFKVLQQIPLYYNEIMDNFRPELFRDSRN